MSVPDMRHCIQHALTYPCREEATIAPLNLVSVGKLSFYEPDEDTFVLLKAAKLALSRGGASCAVLNAANEVAVDAFLHDRIGFCDIFDIVTETLEHLDGAREVHDLDGILDYDRQARERACGEVLKRR
jgi:1-deoxy-D-xylulose-5-phosphate reductoisomerase